VDITGKIADFQPVYTQFLSPGIIHSFALHVPTENVAGIDPCVMSTCSFLIPQVALISVGPQPVSPNAGIPYSQDDEIPFARIQRGVNVAYFFYLTEKGDRFIPVHTEPLSREGDSINPAIAIQRSLSSRKGQKTDSGR